jgi:hypothetical protein
MAEIGDIVHVEYGDDKLYRCRAAIVTDVSDTIIAVTVFRTDGAPYPIRISDGWHTTDNCWMKITAVR